MKTALKLTAEERRAAILQAVRGVFVDKGFHATTTRELAHAAGVSEALLFKHFPSKEALYSAMLDSCQRQEDTRNIERLHALEPSTANLVFLVHFLFSRILGGPLENGDEKSLIRVLLRSLMEDGEFARVALRGRPLEFLKKVRACLQAAVAAGDAVAGPVAADAGGWFMHHLAATLMIHLLPAEPMVDYGMSRDKLQEQAVWFVLRGMGVKDEAIARFYDPDALAVLEEQFAERNGT